MTGNLFYLFIILNYVGSIDERNSSRLVRRKQLLDLMISFNTPVKRYVSELLFTICDENGKNHFRLTSQLTPSRILLNIENIASYS